MTPIVTPAQAGVQMRWRCGSSPNVGGYGVPPARTDETGVRADYRGNRAIAAA